MKILFANLGGSDLKFEGKYFREAQQDVKELVELAMETDTPDLMELVSKLEFPILTPILRQYGPISCLVLFVTRQNPPKPLDTAVIGQLIEILADAKIDPFSNLEEVNLFVIEKKPNVFDNMMKLYSRFMGELGENFQGAVHDELYISLTGGIQACNMALLFSTLNWPMLPGHRVYVYANEVTKTVQELDFPNLINQAHLIQIIDKLLERGKFQAASNTLNINQHSRLFSKLLYVLQLRKNYEYQTALREATKGLNIAKSDDQRFISIFTSLIDELSRLSQATTQQSSFSPVTHAELLVDIYWNMRNEFDNGSYTDVATHFMLLRNQLKVYAICAREQRTIRELYRDYHLDEKTDVVELEKKVGKGFYSEVNNEVISWLQWGTKMQGKRATVAHACKGFTQDELNTHWGGTDFFTDTESMLGAMLKQKPTNPYKKYREFIREEFDFVSRGDSEA